MKSVHAILTLTILAILGGGCSVNKSDNTSTSGIYVLNEGNYSKGNASVTQYDPETGNVTQFAFQNRNGQPLGDLGQSVTHIGDKFYIVVNNSHKIQVVNDNDLSLLGTINIADEASPRYLAKARNGIAYVTNLYGNTVSVIDLEKNEEVDTIPVGDNPEGIAVVSGRAYVANSGLGSGHTVTVIDAKNDTVIDTMNVYDNPTRVKADAEGRVWIVCSGAYNDYQDPNDDTPGRIVVLNGEKGIMVTSFEVGGHPSDLVINEGRGSAYLLNGVVQRLSLTQPGIVDSVFIDRPLYALDMNPYTGSELYGADPKDYTQSGRALVFDLEGTAIDSFKTGIIPGDFFFSEK